MKLQELTALYSDLDIEMSQAMSGPYEDLSYRGDDCEIIAGMKDNRITGFWRPVVACGDEKSLKLHIESLWDICRDIYYMDFLIGGELSVVSKFLLRQGYRARAVYSQVIDLTCHIVTLHAGVRKSYKSLITKTENINYGQITDYAKAHEVYGGHDRPEATWDVQQEMIDKGQAFCVTDGPDVAVLIYHNENCAYYAGGRSSGNSHAALWRAVVQCQVRGMKIFEMGEQAFCAGHRLMDGTRTGQKHIDISLFKRGFGGKTLTRLIVEKV